MTIIPQLEQDLFEAANKHLPAATDSRPELGQGEQSGPSSGTRRARLPRRLRTITTPMPLVLSVLLTLAVAAVALTALQRHHQSSPVPGATTVHSSRQQLIQSFAVLRRPQTKGDLDPRLVPGFFRIVSRPAQLAQQGKRPPTALEKALARWGYPELDRSLVRAVNIPAWDAKLGIEPATFRPSPSSRQRVEGLTLNLWIGKSPMIPPSDDIGTGPQPTSATTVLEHGLATADTPSGSDLNDAVIVVPDGVAAIKLGPFTPGPNASLPGVNAQTLQQATAAIHATGRVHDNVAALQIPVPVVTSRHFPPALAGTAEHLFGIGTEAQDTWFDASGHVIKRTTTQLDLIVRAQLKRAR
jgi:hypothetical protein